MGVLRNLRRLANTGVTRSAARGTPSTRNRMILEPLEPRLLLAAEVAHWVGGAGDWSDPTHWDIGVMPNNGGATTYPVFIDVAGTPTITLDQAVIISTPPVAATAPPTDPARSAGKRSQAVG